MSLLCCLSRTWSDEYQTAGSGLFDVFDVFLGIEQIGRRRHTHWVEGFLGMAELHR
jgi:hypothetical protein